MIEMEFLTPEEAAKLLRRSRKTVVRRFASVGCPITFIKFGP
jgi:hypothetical protein